MGIVDVFDQWCLEVIESTPQSGKSLLKCSVLGLFMFSASPIILMF